RRPAEQLRRDLRRGVVDRHHGRRRAEDGDLRLHRAADLRLPVSRVAGLLYAAVAYVAVVASIGYMLGFLIAAPLPKNIDKGSPTGAIGIVFDVLLIVLFGLQHSLMARPGVKVLVRRAVPEFAERSTYVLGASLVLGVVMLAWQ